MAAAAAAAAPPALDPVRYRLRVRRRSFDSMREQFSRVIVAGADSTVWVAAVADLRAYLLAGKAESDECLCTEGACDNVSIHTAADMDRPMPLGGWAKQMPLTEWLDSLVAAGGPSWMSVVMGSCHHNASQWFIECVVENPETAVTLVGMRAIPDWNSYQVTEHFDNIREAIQYITRHYTPDDGKVTVHAGDTDAEAIVVELPYPRIFEPADYSFFDAAALPLFIEAPERDAKLSFEITWTWP
jgi:hypothetical protein